MTFIIDNDLEESQSVYEYIISQDCQCVLLDPNMEGFIFELKGFNIGQNNKTKLFRAKCKEKFEKEFGKEACDFKDADWAKVFGNTEQEIVNKAKTNSILKALLNAIVGV